MAKTPLKLVARPTEKRAVASSVVASRVVGMVRPSVLAVKHFGQFVRKYLKRPIWKGMKRKMLRQVDRIAVAGKLREADDVGRGDSFLQPLGHADQKVFEEQRAQWR